MNNNNRVELTKRKDGYVISTVKPWTMAWYGKYETGIWYEDEKGECGTIRIAEGYKTEEEAKEGHKKYVNIATEELEKIEWIG